MLRAGWQKNTNYCYSSEPLLPGLGKAIDRAIEATISNLRPAIAKL